MKRKNNHDWTLREHENVFCKNQFLKTFKVQTKGNPNIGETHDNVYSEVVKKYFK